MSTNGIEDSARGNLFCLDWKTQAISVLVALERVIIFIHFHCLHSSPYVWASMILPGWCGSNLGKCACATLGNLPAQVLFRNTGSGEFTDGEGVAVSQIRRRCTAFNEALPGHAVSHLIWHTLSVEHMIDINGLKVFLMISNNTKLLTYMI